MSRPSSGWGWALRGVAAVLLAGWFAGLLLAAVQLDTWHDELTRTLLQIRADAVFQARMAQAGEAIPREWYRNKALALLAESEKLQDDAPWSLFVPGSWPRFDDLRERVAARVERAFSEIAVEAVRRELYFKASQITGVAQDSGAAAAGSGDCSAGAVAPGASSPRNQTAAPGALPEFVALEQKLAALEELDQAVQAMLALQSPGHADAQNLRLLVRYTLGVELPGQLTRGAALFRTSLTPRDLAAAATSVARLQQAARCSVAAAMKALDTRLFDRDGLLAAEVFLGSRMARLFTPVARSIPPLEALEGYREVLAALNEQEALLANGDYGWLREAGGRLDPAHERLLTRISRIGLLGPAAAEQLRRQSAAAVQRFKRRFSVEFGTRKDAGIVWRPEDGRPMLSPQRLALRDGLSALLQEPFMAGSGGREFPVAPPAPLSWDTQRLAQALSVLDDRRRFTAEDLPRFPAPVRRTVAQFVDARLAQSVQDVAIDAMNTQAAAFDATAYGAQREQLAKVEALLTKLGARGRAEQLRALVSRDAVERLALAEQQMWQSPIYSARLQDFGWWQGEGSPILGALGVADGLTLRYSLSQQIGALDAQAEPARVLLGYADASVAASPIAQRWAGTLAELKRYRAGVPASSLRSLEQYLATLGPELNRSNCLERLATAAPATRADEFGLLHQQIHQALTRRCAELRSPASAPDPAQPIPFG